MSEINQREIVEQFLANLGDACRGKVEDFARCRAQQMGENPLMQFCPDAIVRQLSFSTVVEATELCATRCKTFCAKLGHGNVKECAIDDRLQQIKSEPNPFLAGGSEATNAELAKDLAVSM